MRKIECACGIKHDIYVWPTAEVEQDGKKMMERHIVCRCTREVVVRTAPKYEPGAEAGEDEKVATVMSFAELSRQCGVLKETEPHNKPADEDLPPDEKQVDLYAPDRELLSSLVENYGKWFKQGKASAADQKNFFDFSKRIIQAIDVMNLTEEEVRMTKMALSERNIFHIYGEEPSLEDQSKIDALKAALKEALA